MLIFHSPLSMYEDMLNQSFPTYNYIGQIVNMDKHLLKVETDTWPIEALKAYAKYNLGETLVKEEEAYFSLERGGPQGDYRLSCYRVYKVIEALRTRPSSKRALMTIPYNNQFQDSIDEWEDAEFKCLRELYFRTDGETNVLHCTGIMRSQAVDIFPKNIYYIGSLMHLVAESLTLKVGTYTHHCVFLVKDRK
jgi:thymidylate synthase